MSDGIGTRAGIRNTLLFSTSCKGIKRPSNVSHLAIARRETQDRSMRAVRFFMLLAAGAASGQEATGTWTMSPSRSRFGGEPAPRVYTVRFDSHAKGEVFTLTVVPRTGPATTWSIILFLDGKEREVGSCPGTQSSRRLDQRTIEIVYACPDSRTRFVRRVPPRSNVLILDITEKRSDGRQFDRHLILERQKP
jgi:hypothetical protein